MKGNTGFRIKYKSRTLLNSYIEKYGGNGIYDIKGPNSKSDKNALVIYSAEAVSKYLSNTLNNFSHLNSHSGFSESVELLKLLLDLGYTVDYFNLKDPPKIDWQKYELVVDAGNSIQNSKSVSGQKKIFYSTGCHWKTFYGNAFKHTDSFFKRNNSLLYPDRLAGMDYSDEAADIITCFGGSYQKNSFELNKHKVRKINISTTFSPQGHFTKQIASQKKFMWYGGHGPFHKGLDLVVESFLKMPQFELHIFGNIELNIKMFEWFNKVTSQAKNITYHGWATPESAKFKEYATLCDAVVFTSSSEGGAGSVIQCLQFGLIPIINKSTAIDLPKSTFDVIGNSPEEEIESLIENVIKFSETDKGKLEKYSKTLSENYCKINTIQSYADSLKSVITNL